VITLGTLQFGTDITGTTTISNPVKIKFDYENNLHALVKTGKNKVFSLQPMCPLCSQAFSEINTFIKGNVGVDIGFTNNRGEEFTVRILDESLSYTVERDWVEFNIKLLVI